MPKMSKFINTMDIELLLENKVQQWQHQHLYIEVYPFFFVVDLFGLEIVDLKLTDIFNLPWD